MEIHDFLQQYQIDYDEAASKEDLLALIMKNEMEKSILI